MNLMVKFWMLAVLLVLISLPLISAAEIKSELFVSIPYSEKNPLILNPDSSGYADVVIPVTIINVGTKPYKNGAMLLSNCAYAPCLDLSNINVNSDVSSFSLSGSSATKQIISKALAVPQTSPDGLVKLKSFLNLTIQFSPGVCFFDCSAYFNKIIKVPIKLVEPKKSKLAKPIFITTIKGQKKCNTGAKAVPKMLLDWSPAGITENTCDAAKDAYYCDSAQFTLSVLKRIADDQNADFKVNLLGDGFSKDFFEDFVEYYSQDFFTLSPEVKAKVADLKSGKIIFKLILENGSTIILNNLNPATKNQEVWLKPGQYAVTSVSMINQDKQVIGKMVFFKLASEVCASQNTCSFLYYMPMDGKLGFTDKTRVGYGVVFKSASVSANDKIILKLGAGLQSDLTDTSMDIQDNGNVINLIANEDAEKENYSLDTVKLQTTIDGKTLTFYRSVAMPVAIKLAKYIPEGQVDGKYEAFYELLDGEESKTATGQTAWYAGATLLGEATGKVLATPSTESTCAANVSGAYGFSEDKEKGYFTAFAVPYANIDKVFLKKVCPVDAGFKSLQSFVQQIGFNSAVDRIITLEDLITAVKNEKVCMAKDSSSETYSWNPGRLILQLLSQGQ